MYGIKVHDSFDTEDELVEALNHIVSLIEAGFSSGYHPGWELTDPSAPEQPSKLYSREDLGSILATAIEGGIDYWAKILDLTRMTDPSDGYDGLCKRVEFMDREGGEVRYTVTLNDIERAVRLVGQDDTLVGQETRRHILSGDPGWVDAGAADVLVQVACFGRVLYG